jgi:hypothetical protein
MRFLSRLAKRLDRGGSHPPAQKRESGVASYESVLTLQSAAMPGIVFVINRISFGRRMELARRVREIGQRVEFLEAGSQLQEKIEANLLRQEIEATYLRWALVRIEGLMIDGEPATAERLLDSGPEELTQEIVAAIKGQCGLSEAERKN